jgi:hypothetical protein
MYVCSQSEEDKQLQEELNMLVERLQVGILRKDGWLVLQISNSCINVLLLVSNFRFNISRQMKLSKGLPVLCKFSLLYVT